MKPSLKEFLITAICLSVSLFPVKAFAIDATDGADIDPETIKENIKRRIEQVVKTQKQDVQKKTAVLGNLNSVTTNSFSIQTLQGEVKQASDSAFTTIVELPKNKDIKFEDISIGDYIAALGFLNETTKVLDVRRILVLRDPPVASTRKTVFGTITSVDAKKSQIKIKSPKEAADVSIKITSKTSVQITNDGIRKQTLEIKTIPINKPAIIIYTAAKSATDLNTATSILIKTDSLLASPSASPKPKS